MTEDGEQRPLRSQILDRYQSWRRMGRTPEQAITQTARMMQIPEAWVTEVAFDETLRHLMQTA